jgi:hypothetical protein
MANAGGGVTKTDQSPSLPGPSGLGTRTSAAAAPPAVLGHSGVGLKRSYVSITLKRKDGQLHQNTIWPRPEDQEKGQGEEKLMMIQLCDIENEEFNGEIVWPKKLIVKKKTRKNGGNQRHLSQPSKEHGSQVKINFFQEWSEWSNQQTWGI